VGECLPTSLASCDLIPFIHTGSLTVSITDMRAPVVGGSGGVYALCSAHLANVVMVMGLPRMGVWDGTHLVCFTASLSVCPHQNWAGMRCPYKLLRMVLALVCSE
jgi:rhomboid-related protein 1/2/3